MTLSASLLGSLRCFDMAARHCNFTHAAHALHLTPSAVSQQIRHLEDHLGQALFLRQARGLALTEAGRQLQATVTQPLASLAQGVERLRAAPRPLQVTCSPSFAMLWLMPRLSKLHREHPDIELKLVAEFQGVNAQYLQAAGTDCAIRYDPAQYTDLQALDLMPEMLMPVASPRHLDAYGGLANPKSLARHTLLHDASPWDEAPPGVEWQAWLDAVWPGKTAALARAPQQEFNLSMLALTAARNHQGLAMGRLSLIGEDLAAGTLVAVHPMRVASPARYVLLTTREPDSRVQVFSRWLQKECERFQDDLRRQLDATEGARPARHKRPARSTG